MLSSSTPDEVSALPAFESDSELALAGSGAGGDSMRSIGSHVGGQPRVLQVSVENDVFSCAQISRPGAEMNAETQDPLVDLTSGGVVALSTCIVLCNPARFDSWTQRFVVSGKSRTRSLAPTDLPVWYRQTVAAEHPADST